MANSEHLEIVRGGVVAIAAWRATHYEQLDLRWADLGGAYLRDANLYRADLGGADLGGANLYRASLRSANLSEANLYGANLRGAKLSGANLSRADLRGADLRGANLFGADLSGTNLSGALWDYTTIGTAPAPEGDLIGWGKKGGLLVKMLVPAAARRSCATTRKFRAEYVQVLEIESGVQRVEHFSEHGAATYEVGQITRADEWDDDRWNECSHGIHFFLSRHEAERWA